MSSQFNFSDGNKRELVMIDESGDVWVRHDIKPLDVAKIIKTMSERIKRLEEAGDVLVSILRDAEMQDFCDWVDKSHDAKIAWTAAKEAKP